MVIQSIKKDNISLDTMVPHILPKYLKLYLNSIRSGSFADIAYTNIVG